MTSKNKQDQTVPVVNEKKETGKEPTIHTVDVDAATGDEIVITANGLSIVVKVGVNVLLADFVEGMTKAIELNPNAVYVAALRVLHKEPKAATLLRARLAELRDEVFTAFETTEGAPDNA